MHLDLIKQSHGAALPRMKMWLACLSFLLCTVISLAAGISEGMSRQEVETRLGRPLSTLDKGETTILRYPNQGRVEFVAGKVVRMTHVPRLDDSAPTPAQVASEPAPTEVPVKTVPEIREKAPPSEPEPESEWAINTKAQQEFEAAVERLANPPQTGSSGLLAEDMGLVASPTHFWLHLVVALFVHVAVGMVVLKLAFAWTEVHADWLQMFFPALAAALSGALVRGVAYALWHTEHLFYLDDAVSYGVLFFALLKATHACTWQRAAGVAMASKLMSMVIWVFLSVAVSQVLFA